MLLSTGGGRTAIHTPNSNTSRQAQELTGNDTDTSHGVRDDG